MAVRSAVSMVDSTAEQRVWSWVECSAVRKDEKRVARLAARMAQRRAGWSVLRWDGLMAVPTAGSSAGS